MDGGDGAELLEFPWPLQEVLVQLTLLAGAQLHRDLGSKAGVRNSTSWNKAEIVI